MSRGTRVTGRPEDRISSGGGGIAVKVELGQVVDIAFAPDGAAHDDDPPGLLEQARVAPPQFRQVRQGADADDGQLSGVLLNHSAIGLGERDGFEGLKGRPGRLAQSILAKDMAGRR